MKHDLKCWPEPFSETLAGRKRHEFRRDDRGFNVGDFIRLREWDPDSADYTGRDLFLRITYVSRGPSHGIPYGFAALSIDLLVGCEPVPVSPRPENDSRGETR